MAAHRKVVYLNDDVPEEDEVLQRLSLVGPRRVSETLRRYILIGMRACDREDGLGVAPALPPPEPPAASPAFGDPKMNGSAVQEDEGVDGVRPVRTLGEARKPVGNPPSKPVAKPVVGGAPRQPVPSTPAPPVGRKPVAGRKRPDIGKLFGE